MSNDLSNDEAPVSSNSPDAARQARRRKWLIAWTVAAVGLTAIAAAWLMTGTQRVVGEAYVILEAPASNTFQQVAVFALGERVEWPGQHHDAAPRHWLDLEVHMNPSERWAERLDRRSLAPPGVTLTGPDGHPLYPLTAETLPDLLMQELRLYPEEGFDDEVEQIMRVLAWLGQPGSMDPNDEATGRDAFDARFGDELAALFESVRYVPPRLYEEAAPRWLLPAILLFGAAVWGAGAFIIRRSTAPKAKWIEVG